MARGRSTTGRRAGATARSAPPHTRVARWIAALPQGAQLAWSEDTISPQVGATRGWLDVRVPELCEQAELGWAWSVEGPDLPDPGDGPLTIALDYDAVCELSLRGGQLVGARIVADGAEAREVPVADVAHWAGQSRLHAMDGDLEVRRVGVWTEAAVSAAIGRWCAAVGRPDLQISWDRDAGPSPMVLELERIAAELEDQDGLGAGALQIGEGVFALPDAFDQLLAMDPDEAAKITGALSEIARDDA